LVEPSTSVKRKVTVPEGRSFRISVMMLPGRGDVTSREPRRGLRTKALDVKLRCHTVALCVVLSATLGSALPAAAKDGVHATLTTNVPLDARPGTKLTIGWRLAYAEDGERHLFGASGVFVRLGSASGAAAETGYATEDGGSYTSNIAVPEGGIGDVQIGLRGYTSGVRTGRSDLLFPITNDPLPGEPRVASSRTARPVRGPAEGGTRWMLVVAAGLLLTLATTAVITGRRALRNTRARPPSEVRPL
jgi:hypothetical protein